MSEHEELIKLLKEILDEVKKARTENHYHYHYDNQPRQTTTVTSGNGGITANTGGNWR